ncbi:MAG: ABC transporter permease [Bacilli bacterium]
MAKNNKSQIDFNDPVSIDKIDTLDKSLFEFVDNHEFQIDRVEGEAIGFFKDAWRRLVSKKTSIISMIVLGILVFGSVVFPLISGYSYNEQVLKDEYDIAEVKELPPRMPLLEKIGIADGIVETQLDEESLKQYDEKYYDIIDEKSTVLGKSYEVEIDYYKALGLKEKGDNKYFFFGTDNLGRDYWTRVWYGGRISLFVGLVATVINITIGIIWGGIAGFFGGSKVDMFMMRFAEILYSIPTLVWVTLLSLIFSAGLKAILISLAITGWIGTAQLVRSQFLKLRGQEFVLASRTLGSSNLRLIAKHLFPNIIGQIVVLLTVMIPGAIFYEAFLAFIGLGVQPPIPSIGILINDGRLTIQTLPRMIIFPSVFISFLMLSIQLLSNGLRDALDPRMKNK